MRYLALIIVLTFYSCGGYKTKNIKHYNFKVTGDCAGNSKTPRLMFYSLVDDFNYFARMNILKYDNNVEYNSTIKLIQNLGKGTKIIGYGQWRGKKDRDNIKKIDVIYHSMALEFDREYICSRFINRDIDEDNIYEMRKLFFHEVGHGLEMGHNEDDPGDMMYPTINGEKDFDKFFKQVRDYMNE